MSCAVGFIWLHQVMSIANQLKCCTYICHMRCRLQILGLNRSMLLQLCSEHLLGEKLLAKYQEMPALNFRVVDEL